MTDIVEQLEKFGSKWPYDAALAEIRSLRQQLADKDDALRDLKADVETWLADNKEKFEALEQQLAECQAREKVLRDELEYANELSPTISESRDAALALPSDSTALDTLKRQWQHEALLEAAVWFDEVEGYLETGKDKAAALQLRRMAKELE